MARWRTRKTRRKRQSRKQLKGKTNKRRFIKHVKSRYKRKTQTKRFRKNYAKKSRHKQKRFRSLQKGGMKMTARESMRWAQVREQALRAARQRTKLVVEEGDMRGHDICFGRFELMEDVAGVALVNSRGVWQKKKGKEKQEVETQRRWESELPAARSVDTWTPHPS